MFCEEDFKTAENIAGLLNSADVVYCVYGSYAEVMYGILKKGDMNNDFDFLLRSDSENLTKAHSVLEKNFKLSRQLYDYVVSKIIINERDSKFELLFSDILCPGLSKKSWPWENISELNGIKILPIEDFAVLKQHDLLVLKSGKERKSLERILKKFPELNPGGIEARAKQLFSQPYYPTAIF